MSNSFANLQTDIISDYDVPLVQLLNLEVDSSQSTWPDYLNLGFTEAHVPELIRMLKDDSLHNASNVTVWAPLHAWRILAALKAESAIPALLGQLRRLDENHDDWIAHEFPKVFQAIGSCAITPLAQYIGDPANGCWAKNCAYQCLSKIGIAYPEHRGVCIEILARNLQMFGSTHDHVLNACLVNALLDLKAVEAIDTIRVAFANNQVDLTLVGDIEDVEIELHLRHVRTTPRKLNQLTGFIEKVRTSIQRASQNKMGRNDPCPCGSGKKFKKCCLN